jgi:hypothetical protein
LLSLDLSQGWSHILILRPLWDLRVFLDFGHRDRLFDLVQVGF